MPRRSARLRNRTLTSSDTTATNEFEDELTRGGPEAHNDVDDEMRSESDIEGGFGPGGDGDEDEEIEDEDDEIFIVEKILDHRIENDGELRFKVKWEGYDEPGDLTWEPEENLESAPDILKAYFKKIGGREKAFEEIPKANSNKKKRNRLSVNNAGSDTGSQSSVKRTRTSHPGDSTPPKQNKGKFVPPSGSWEDHIAEIDAIQGDDGQLWIYLKWKSGDKTRHDTKTIYKRCPQQMLRFYERHIKIVHSGNSSREGSGTETRRGTKRDSES